jgi:transcriptional regulator with XRE-family HTH domain
VANYLGISRTTLNRKLNGSSEFKISEIKLIHKQYNVPLSLFFEE